jgi:hypothetical protein
MKINLLSLLFGSFGEKEGAVETLQPEEHNPLLNSKSWLVDALSKSSLLPPVVEISQKQDNSGLITAVLLTGQLRALEISYKPLRSRLLEQLGGTFELFYVGPKDASYDQGAEALHRIPEFQAEFAYEQTPLEGARCPPRNHSDSLDSLPFTNVENGNPPYCLLKCLKDDSTNMAEYLNGMEAVYNDHVAAQQQGGCNDAYHGLHDPYG